MNGMQILAYYLIWISCVLYSFYCFILESRQFAYSFLLNTNDLIPGWFHAYYKDVSDFEWNSLRLTFIHYFHWILIHIILTQCFSRFFPKFLPVLFITYSSLAIIDVLGPMALSIIWANVLLYLFLHLFGCQSVCYALFVTLLYCVHSPFTSLIKQFCKLNERQWFLFEVSVAWLNAKCLSFSVDRIRCGDHKKPITLRTILEIISYCIYLPTIFTGPIHQYSSFINDFHKLPIKWTSSRLYFILREAIRYTFWTLMLEIMLHFVYSSSIQYYPELCERLSVWALSGLGYTLPLMFFIKYFVIYGSIGLIGFIDGFDLPPPPKCISRIHLCTHLWRSFDRGLHLWLSNYFYKPLIGSKWSVTRRIVAGCVCFSCICLWHGMDEAVVVWCALNFFGVSSEIIANAIDSTQFWHSIKNKLSTDGQRTLKAIISSPFFAIAFVSNIYFLSNWDVGCLFVRKILTSFPTPLLPTLIILYCGCQVSTHYKLKEQIHTQKFT